MKKTLIFLFFITINLYSYSQFSEPFRNSRIVLKKGDTLNGKGKTQRKGFKYKAYAQAKPYYIEFSEIDYIEQQFSREKIKLFRFFQTNNSNKYVKVEELVMGDFTELYGVVNNVNSGGSISMSMTIVEYFIKKKSESKLTKLGSYNTLSNSLKEKVKIYFSDCKKLIDKIESKEFKMHEGLEQIVEFYNRNCNSE